MPKAGFLVARFKWLNYIPDWPAPRILWQLKWREFLQGKCPIHTVLWLFNILKFDFQNEYFLLHFIICKHFDWWNTRAITSWNLFNITGRMKDKLCNFVFIEHWRIQYIFDLIQFLEFPTLHIGIYIPIYMNEQTFIIYTTSSLSFYRITSL